MAEKEQESSDQKIKLKFLVPSKLLSKAHFSSSVKEGK